MSDHSHSHEQETDDISSFDDILGMLCPQEATTVRKVGSIAILDGSVFLFLNSNPTECTGSFKSRV